MYCFVVVADTVGYIRIFSILCDLNVFFFYMYELRLSATMLLNEYDDDDDELHMERHKGSFSVMKVPYGTLNIKRLTQFLEFKLLLITAKNSSVIMYA